MSRRKRQGKTAERSRPPPLSVRFTEGLRLFVKQQVRFVVLFVGIAWLSQLYMFPHYPDVLFFGAMGGAMLGLSMPGRFWK